MEGRFKPVEWSYTTNIYEVNLRQYTQEGTFRAFAASLPRLRDMGVEVLWFMPITPIGKEKRLGTLGSYYACSDYTKTNPEFGSVLDFSHLVAEAHTLGFKVIIDWVANHTAWDHIWTTTNPAFYKKNSAGEFYDSNNWSDVIDLNYYDHTMRKEMIKSMRFWIETCNIDGFRCDMAHLVPLDFWREARVELDQIKPLFWLAETEHISYHQVFDCSYAWQWMHATEAFCRGNMSMKDLVNVLIGMQDQFPPNAFHAFFTSNHDENSWNGTEYEKYGVATKALAVFSATWNGIPLTYTGQELPSHKRLRFFEKDPVEWNGKYELQELYCKLFKLRKENPSLRAGYLDTKTILLENNCPDNVFTYMRRSGNNEVIVALNLSPNSCTVQLTSAEIAGTYQNIFDGSMINLHDHNSHHLEPGGFYVWAK